MNFYTALTMGNGALRPRTEHHLRELAKLPEDGSDLVGSTVEELIARIVRLRGMARLNLLCYDKQVEMALHVQNEEAENDDAVLLPEALSKFRTLKDSPEMKPLYHNVATAQSDFEDTEGADDKALREATSALMTQLPECIQAKACAPGSLTEFTHVVATGNEFFEGVYTQVGTGTHRQICREQYTYRYTYILYYLYI